MIAVFKCQNCANTFFQNMEDLREVTPDVFAPVGLMVADCPYCKHNYMDCQNLEECLEWLLSLSQTDSPTN